MHKPRLRWKTAPPIRYRSYLVVAAIVGLHFRLMALRKLLFIDTNVWLDFYRAQNDAFMGLLEHAEQIAGDIIVTYQVEREFKTNREKVILDAIKPTMLRLWGR